MRQEVYGMRFEVDGRRVVYETIDGELILIHMETGFYYSLDGTGVEIWQGLLAGCTPEEVSRRLRTRYEAPVGSIEGSVSGLVERLREEGLLDVARRPSPPRPAAASTIAGDRDAQPEREQFEAPVLHRYTDMADFMLVDPIHEVDETGWPNRKVAP
jgi:hypothetical protein